MEGQGDEAYATRDRNILIAVRDEPSAEPAGALGRVAARHSSRCAPLDARPAALPLRGDLDQMSATRRLDQLRQKETVGGGYANVNVFLDTIKLDSFKIIAVERKKIAERIKALQPEASRADRQTQAFSAHLPPSAGDIEKGPIWIERCRF